MQITPKENDRLANIRVFDRTSIVKSTFEYPSFRKMVELVLRGAREEKIKGNRKRQNREHVKRNSGEENIIPRSSIRDKIRKYRKRRKIGQNLYVHTIFRICYQTEISSGNGSRSSSMYPHFLK